MGVMGLISGVGGADAALDDGFRTFTGVLGDAVSGLVWVAIRVKL
jgi:hypothetical protein